MLDRLALSRPTQAETPTAEAERPLEAQAGPQRAFVESDADVVVYGGAAGGGKTFGLLLAAARRTNEPDFGAVFFRRTSPELVGSGSIWERSKSVFRLLGGRSREGGHLDWRFPSGATCEFRHLQYDDDVYAHQGKQYSLVCFDELTHFSSQQFWYLLSRLRGNRPRMRAGCNPDPDSWVRAFLDWWIDDRTGQPFAERAGVVRWFARAEDDSIAWADSREELLERLPRSKPLSCTFIPSRLADNPAMALADPDYEARLEALPRVERERLRDGDWNSRASAGSLFKRSWLPVVEPPEEHRVVARVRFWDKAATRPSATNPDPDHTVGVRVALLEDRTWLVEHVEETRDTPGGVVALMGRIAEQDGRTCVVGLWQDPGQAGLVDVEATQNALSGFAVQSVRAAQSKVAYALPVSAHAEKGRIRLLRGPWLERFLRVLEAFPDGAHDDDVDALSGAFQILPELAAQGLVASGGARSSPRLYGLGGKVATLGRHR